MEFQKVKSVRALFLVDLKKVFDIVNHSILLKKLDYYEIRGIANKGFLRIVFVRYRSICLN